LQPNTPSTIDAANTHLIAPSRRWKNMALPFRAAAPDTAAAAIVSSQPVCSPSHTDDSGSSHKQAASPTPRIDCAARHDSTVATRRPFYVSLSTVLRATYR
jgi:hypothetical protein